MMRFRGIAFLLTLILAAAYLASPATAGCDTPVTLPANFTYQTPPASLGGTGIVTGQIRDGPSNCPWTLPVVVAVVNATGYTVAPNGIDVVGTIGVFYGPFSCTPTTQYTIPNVNVTGPGNNTYRVIAYYNFTHPVKGQVPLIGMSQAFSISSNGDTVTLDVIIYWGLDCNVTTTTPTTTATTTTTTTTTPPTTTATTTTNTATTMTTTTPTITTTTTAPPTTTTTKTPWPGLGIAAAVLLAYAMLAQRRGRNREP